MCQIEKRKSKFHYDFRQKRNELDTNCIVGLRKANCINHLGKSKLRRIKM